MKKTALKNISAVILGFSITLVLTRGTDILLENTGIFPTVEQQQKFGFNILWMNLVAISYRIVFTIAGGFITVKLSASKPIRNIMILGITGTMIAIAGNLVVSQIPEMADVLPLWFSIALVIIAYPSVWIGGRLANAYSQSQKS
ncbi:MAG: hypothetical protein V4635_16435 [Bacteroidota bacterium]